MIFPLRNHPGEKAFSDAVNVFNSAELTRQEAILLRGLKGARLLIGTYQQPSKYGLNLAGKYGLKLAVNMG